MCRSSFATSRNPRLFYVSSATSTSLATTLCYIADPNVCNCAGAGNCNANTINTACPACAFVDGKRRRRAIPDDVDQVDATEEEDSFERWEIIQMTKLFLVCLSTNDDMEDNSMKREARAMLYWVTTTSTFTWYTSTSTIATIECTPSGFTVSRCI